MGLATKTQKYFFLPFYRSGQERVEESFLFSLLSYALAPTLSPKGRGRLPTNSWRTVLMVVSFQALLACGLFDEIFPVRPHNPHNRDSIYRYSPQANSRHA